MIDPIDISDLIPANLDTLKFARPSVAFVPVRQQPKPRRGWEVDPRRSRFRPTPSEWIVPGIEPEELFSADAGELAVHLLSRDMAARRM